MTGQKLRCAAIAAGMAAVLTVCAGSVRAEELGPVTNLPIPRYVSLKADEANVRRGPGTSHRIDWVFQRRDMPLRVTGEYSNWRRVVDIDGAGGWVHYTLLSGVRTVLVSRDMTPVLTRPEDGAEVNAYAEAGVIARLDSCADNWCRISGEGFRGWAEESALWGVEPGETVR